MPRALLVAALVLAASLAGCARDEGGVELQEAAMGRIEGVVTDASLAPLAGARVRVDGLPQEALADAAGAFALDVPAGEHLVLASAEGHRGQAQRASPQPGQAARLEFVLPPLPREAPHVEQTEAHGLLSCRALVEQGAQRSSLSCGGQDPNERAAHAFPVSSLEGLEGVVVELAWEPATDAASVLELRVLADAGGEPALLAAATGERHVKVVLPSAALAQGLPPGAGLLVEVEPAGSLTDEEAGVDAALVVQQPFAVYVSLFYRAPPPGGYTVLSG